MTREPGPIRILELRSVKGTGGGPEKTIILGTARTDARRFDITVCYLRDARDPVFAVDGQAKALGGRYVEIVEKHSLDASIWKPLAALVRDRSIDIVHSHDYKTDLLAWLLARRTGVLPLATAHGWTGHSPRERRLYYPVDKRLLARFPRVIAVSHEVRSELVRTGSRAERVDVVLNGIDAQQFVRRPDGEAAVRESLGLEPETFVVGSVGRLEPQKRFDLLLQAFAAVRSHAPHLRLVIAGDGSERVRLDAMVRQLGLDASCLLLGHRTDVALLHHAFDLFVQASDYEGTPNAVLEAMAMGTPVVATSAGGTAELVRDGIDGLVVAPGSAGLLATAIDAVLHDLGAARSRAQSARRRVETDLSFDTRMRRVEAIYTSLVDGRRRTAGTRRAAS
jgi:glycosyltransferase involved in cell wall biosynthesis